jgi:hypothetical protein
MVVGGDIHLILSFFFGIVGLSPIDFGIKIVFRDVHFTLNPGNVGEIT